MWGEGGGGGGRERGRDREREAETVSQTDRKTEQTDGCKTPDHKTAAARYIKHMTEHSLWRR